MLKQVDLRSEWLGQLVHESLVGPPLAIGLRIDTERPKLNAHVVGAVGLHHVRADFDARGGSMAPPILHVLSPRAVWNPAVTLAAGASLQLTPRLGVSAQLTAVLVEPALEVVSNGRSVGTLGAPSSERNSAIVAL